MDQGRAPTLDVRFGSSRHKVCDVPFRRDQIVVAPSLFGCEHNAATFHDLRDVIHDASRGARNDPTRAYGVHRGDVGPLAVKAKSWALRAAIQRICEYFSIERGSCVIGLVYLGGVPGTKHLTPHPYVLSAMSDGHGVPNRSVFRYASDPRAGCSFALF
jgi:hypothetical protein